MTRPGNRRSTPPAIRGRPGNRLPEALLEPRVLQASIAAVRLELQSGDAALRAEIAAAVADLEGQLPPGEVHTTTVDRTFDDDDAAFLVDASGGPVTITLPDPAGESGRRCVVKKTDASANAVTVDVDGGGTIDGAPSASLPAQNDRLEAIGTGTEWISL